jgi:hypothetical protein
MCVSASAEYIMRKTIEDEKSFRYKLHIFLRNFLLFSHAHRKDLKFGDIIPPIKYVVPLEKATHVCVDLNLNFSLN